jgi:integrase
LLVLTGLRFGEATALQWNYVDLDAGTIKGRQAWKRSKKKNAAGGHGQMKRRTTRTE